jgi:hypothetical protein
MYMCHCQERSDEATSCPSSHACRHERLSHLSRGNRANPYWCAPHSAAPCLIAITARTASVTNALVAKRTGSLPESTSVSHAPAPLVQRCSWMVRAEQHHLHRRESPMQRTLHLRDQLRNVCPAKAPVSNHPDHASLSGIPAAGSLARLLAGPRRCTSFPERPAGSPGLRLQVLPHLVSIVIQGQASFASSLMLQCKHHDV